MLKIGIAAGIICLLNPWFAPGKHAGCLSSQVIDTLAAHKEGEKLSYFTTILGTGGYKLEIQTVYFFDKQVLENWIEPNSTVTKQTLIFK